MTTMTSRRAREITQWTFVVLAIVAVVGLIAGVHGLAVTFAILAGVVLLVAVAQSVATGLGRRGGGGS
jgi:Mg2+/citrate symporter